jgi:hypothetical protein
MEHLEDVKMSYFTHMRHAFIYSLKSGIASIIFVIHGIYPDVFTQMGYVLTKEIVDEIEELKEKSKRKK